MLFLDQGSTLSFVTPCIVVNFGVSPETHLELFVISTLVGDPVIARQVYQNYLVIVLKTHLSRSFGFQNARL